MMKLHPDGRDLHLDGPALFTGHKGSLNGLVGMKTMDERHLVRLSFHSRFCIGFSETVPDVQTIDAKMFYVRCSSASWFIHICIAYMLMLT